MLFDLEEPCSNAVDCDVCIIGSGVIGTAIAREFLGTKIDVVLLESGGKGPEPCSADLNSSLVANSFFLGATEGRERRLGGTSHKWGGQALPLDSLDFEERDWVACSGWPIDKITLEPFMSRASDYLKLDNLDFDKDVFNQFGISPLEIPEEFAKLHISKWSPNPNTWKLYGGAITFDRRIQVFTHATVTDIELSDSGSHIQLVKARSLAGKTLTVRANHFVLCAGALETARLLLSASERSGRPIGAGSGMVGRCLLDHPSGEIARLVSNHPAEVQELFNMFYIGQRKYSVRISLAESFQRSHRTLNASCGFSFNLRSGQGADALRIGYRAIRRNDWVAAGSAGVQTLRSSPSAASWAYHRLLRHRARYDGARVSVVINCEQQPEMSNLVRLSSQFDALGVRRSEIIWSPSEATAATARLFSKQLAALVSRLGIGRLELSPWLSERGGEWREYLHDAFHPMGTTRMAKSPDSGVVDHEGRIFGLENGWIAGTAVFPTSGHSNPTFTALALAIRLSDTIKSELP